MAHNAQTAFGPRKMPVQARSAVTVEAISEATIQVLLSRGADRLTTTRVAERAGVSVGTLYQYYPNKQSLLFAVLEHHLDKVSAAVEAACQRARGKPLAEIASRERGRQSGERLNSILCGRAAWKLNICR